MACLYSKVAFHTFIARSPSLHIGALPEKNSPPKMKLQIWSKAVCRPGRRLSQTVL